MLKEDVIKEIYSRFPGKIKKISKFEISQNKHFFFFNVTVHNYWNKFYGCLNRDGTNLWEVLNNLEDFIGRHIEGKIITYRIKKFSLLYHQWLDIHKEFDYLEEAKKYIEENKNFTIQSYKIIKQEFKETEVLNYDIF